MQTHHYGSLSLNKIANIFKQTGAYRDKKEIQQFEIRGLRSKLKQKPKKLVFECSCCGNAFKSCSAEEDIKSPYYDCDGHIICDECYREHYQTECFCGEYFDTDEKIGRIIAIIDYAPADSGDDIEPGHYRVLKHPLYADWMFSGYLYREALEKVADIDSEFVCEDAQPSCFELCPQCQQESLKNHTGE